MFSISSLGVGAVIGALTGGVVIHYKLPRLGYLLSAIVAFLLTFFGLMTDDELENNKYAKDVEEGEDEKEQRPLCERLAKIIK